MLPGHDDPMREMRALKGWMYLFTLVALLSLQPLSIFALGLSLLQSGLLFIISLALAALLIEFATRYSSQLRRRGVLPILLGIQLAGIHDLDGAGQAAADWVGRWLRPKAAVIAWQGEDNNEMKPVAAFGQHAAWKETAPTLAMGQYSLKEPTSISCSIFSRGIR